MTTVFLVYEEDDFFYDKMVRVFSSLGKAQMWINERPNKYKFYWKEVDVDE